MHSLLNLQKFIEPFACGTASEHLDFDFDFMVLDAL